MNHYFWASSLLLFAVVQYAAAFKIPGLSSSSSSSSINRTPPVRGPANNAGGHRGHESEYMGPVFIIRELDKDKGEYDAFVTTGGIQEVRPPPMSDRSLPPQHSKPSAARDDEDAEHFGVLVTPETVKRLDRDEKLKMSSINVTMSVLLSAASSRMPWLLVLHRKQYPHLFEYQQQQPQQQYQVHSPQQQPHQQPHPQQYHQQQPQQYQQQVPPFLQPAQSDSVQVDSGVPGLQNPQIPQRRRYQTDRQRRAILYSSPDDSRAPLTMAFEHQLLSTMCYNFVRDYYSSPAQQMSSAELSPRLPIALADPEYGRGEDRREREPEPEQYGRYRQDVYLDADAYAAAATAPSGRVPHSPPQPQPQPQTSSTVRPEERSDGVVVGMEIPKRVS
ncbi:putative mediator of RNA polymerase II transcription subunit 26 [Myzus persicae]|uniref:putative mediator of RNA polymerase II transcription subunit 26 n=1 Tax=Myzus persicae TaxID=13164 RepID=UPI000B931E38|nr:putative mediator of RNA polymerase II transcription subunit 26 [Myzus persicae]